MEHFARGQLLCSLRRWSVHHNPLRLVLTSHFSFFFPSSLFAFSISSPNETSSPDDSGFVYLRRLTPLLAFPLYHLSETITLHSSTRTGHAHIDASHAMTTTSSLPFATMEVPAAEDSMEMASPYQGQADDFDIDIDIMEDQASNMDSDMMGADDYPTSQPSLFPNDTNNDADMADGPSEGSMVDADDYVDEDQDVEVQDEEATFGAEMQDGDQGVNIGASGLPTIQIDSAADESNEPVSTVTETVEQGEPQKVEEGASELAKISSTDLQPQTGEDHEQKIALEPSVADSDQPELADGTGDPSVNVDAHTTQDAAESSGTISTKNLSAEGSETHAEAVTEDLIKSQAKPASREANDEHVGEGSHNLHHAEDQDHQHDESLHPVKVIYQDNEISLFPPLEGDSAETFFLHDEDLAYDTIGKLFGSLREVLLDNVAENEILVIDIDSLGIQITEVSRMSYPSSGCI